MRKVLSPVLLCVFLLSLVLPAAAQDDMMEGTVCDSTLITLLFIAEYEYGYAPMLDVSTFEKGQYAPLFTSMMDMMMEEDMEEDMMEEEEMMEEDMGEDMMEDMAMLAPGNIEGEPAECSDLRASVESFLYDHFASELGMMMEEG